MGGGCASPRAVPCGHPGVSSSVTRPEQLGAGGNGCEQLSFINSHPLLTCSHQSLPADTSTGSHSPGTAGEYTSQRVSLESSSSMGPHPVSSSHLGGGGGGYMYKGGRSAG